MIGGILLCGGGVGVVTFDREWEWEVSRTSFVLRQCRSRVAVIVGRVFSCERLFLGIGFTPLKRVSDAVMGSWATVVEVSAAPGFPGKLVQSRILILPVGRTSIDIGSTAGMRAIGAL